MENRIAAAALEIPQMRRKIKYLIQTILGTSDSTAYEGKKNSTSANKEKRGS